MGHLTHRAADERCDDRIFVRCRRFGPLLELDDYHGISAVVVGAGEYEINSLGGLWDRVLNCNAGAFGNLAVDEHVVHVL
jgi:hypothetical protein